MSLNQSSMFCSVGFASSSKRSQRVHVVSPYFQGVRASAPVFGSVLATNLLLGCRDRFRETEEWQSKVDEAVLVIFQIVLLVNHLQSQVSSAYIR